MNIKIEKAGESILIKNAGTSTANGRYYKFSSIKYIASNGNGNTIQLIPAGPNYWALKDISTREETGPGDPPEYAYAYRNTVADPNSVSFSTSWTVDLGQSQAPTSSYSFGGKVTSTKGGSGKLIEKKYIDLIPSPNNLLLYFDPVFYKEFGKKYDYSPGSDPAAQYDPWYLKEFRDYNISNVVPSRPLSQQWIQGGSLGTSKAQIINNTLSYIKDPNNNDLEPRRNRKNYQSISKTLADQGITPPVENKKPFLILSRDNNAGVYSYSNVTQSTLNIFVRLQRPLAHLSPQNPAYVVREKKGIFCTYGVNVNRGFSIGYRSPHHYINGDRTYKLKFEPFSFVFSLGNGSSSYYNRPICQTLMTDFKFKFGKMYMLTVVKNSSGDVLIYINGELQSVANVPFNPLRRSTSTRNSRTNHVRKLESPIGPNFIMFDGSTYPNVSSLSALEASLSLGQGNAFIFGKSNLNGSRTPPNFAHPNGSRTTKRRKRFFNNIDLGVINTYNVALSQAQISQFYENFRYRYE